MRNEVDEVGVSGTGAEPATARTVNVVKVFSATKASDRHALGEAVTAWLAQRPHLQVVKTFVLLSSDARFHCLSIVVMGVEAPRAG